MTEGHVANVQGFKLMKVVTLMLGYGDTKFDRLKDGATMLALTSNSSLRIPSSLVKIFDTDAGGSKPIAITFSGRIHGRDLCSRPLEGEQWLKQNLGNIQSLERGPVPPSDGSSCTHTPGRGSGHCPLGEMNFAGHNVAHAPPAFPDAIVNFAAASVTN
ncbi:hypothetical protein NC651_039549 [Populus alba x Populus x berolinensis]|nr:hypothetical protein NC651_039549 [Populus alba x Populus x berolinensis]